MHKKYTTFKIKIKYINKSYVLAPFAFKIKVEKKTT